MNKNLLTLKNISLTTILVLPSLTIAFPILTLPFAFLVIPAMVVYAKRSHPIIPLLIFLSLSVFGILVTKNPIFLFSMPIISVLFFTILILLRRQKNHIQSIAITCAFSLFACLSCFLIAGLSAKSLDTNASLKHYIQSSQSDMIVVSLAKRSFKEHYDGLKESEDEFSEPLESIDFDNIYASFTPTIETERALAHLALATASDFDKYFPELILIYAVSLGLATFLLGYLSLQPTYDTSLTSENGQALLYFPEALRRYKQINPSDFRQPFSMLTMPKEFFVLVFLPITGLMWLNMSNDFGLVFGVMWSGLCITPYAFSGLALSFYFIDYIDNTHLNMTLKIAFLIILSLSVLNSTILFAFSLFGVADSILHTRRLLEKVLLN